MNNSKYVSVSLVNSYISRMFDENLALRDVYIEGEISNFKISNKHMYFSLKDEFSEISAMYFYPQNKQVDFDIVDGQSVQVSGKISVYQKRGSYQIIVNKISQTGIGLLYQKFLDLKELLNKEGLFDESKKLKVPEYPRCIGVVTASSGDAIHDIISTFNRRLPLMEIHFYNAIVQGKEAPKSLIAALKKCYKDSDLDTIIIGRGGGSFEDLSCFNDEELARTLFMSPIPTVSAIGHEQDYTICDFVASLRAPTPTGAAMLLSKERNEVIDLIVSLAKRVNNGVKTKLISSFNEYKKYSNSYGISHFDEVINLKEQNLLKLDSLIHQASPSNLLKNKEIELNNYENSIKKISIDNFNTSLLNYNHLSARLNKDLLISQIDKLETDIDNYYYRSNSLIKTYITATQKELSSLINKAVILNPFNLMDKGYSITYKNDLIVTSVKDLAVNDEIKVQLRDGSAYAKLNKVEVENGK